MSSGAIHAANREWAFEALDALQSFFEDEDFHGDAEEERALVERKRKELKEGKYRVVFLGAFNVGKTTLVNALLGDEYLPTVLEECTAKITHVAKADSMRAVLKLLAPPTDQELDALRELLAAYDIAAEASVSEAGDELSIDYTTTLARDLRVSMTALVTMSSEDDYPKLRTLRAKFEELFIYLPGVMLEDDIAFVDSPGVHSMSESNARLTSEVIPHSHLVVCLIDSQSAGNATDRGFIENIAKHCQRKVMFVINKSDQLNPDEIDLLGHRGPAKDLLRSVEGVLDGPELFFASGLYSLISQQLADGRITLESLDANNKVKLPLGLLRQLLSSEAPEKAAAEYLSEQSRLQSFRERLITYLYNENSEGAVLDSVCHFLANKAWKLSRPLEIQLELARDIPRLGELETAREALLAKLDQNKRQAADAIALFKRLADGQQGSGYAALVENLLNEKTIEAQVLAPLRQWLQRSENFRKAKRGGFEPLRKEIDGVIDRFIGNVVASVNQGADNIEQSLRDQLAGTVENIEGAAVSPVTVTRASSTPIKVCLCGSYGGFITGGGVLGAAACGGLSFWKPAAGWIDTAIAQTPNAKDILSNINIPGVETVQLVAVAAGLVAGLLAGFVLRGLSADGTRRKRVNAALTGQVLGLLANASGNVKAQLSKNVQERRAEFAAAVQGCYDQVTASLQQQLADVQAEEDDLRRKQEEAIARLEPKLTFFNEMLDKARGIAESRLSAEVEALAGKLE